MAISDFLTPEQANLLLDQQFSSPQGIARLNPLAFQYEDAFTPYSERQMNALKVMRLPSKLYDPSYSDPAFFSDTLSGYSYDPYLGTKENNFNYLYGTRPAFKYETMSETNPSIFTGVDLESGYLDRAGSYGQDVYAEQVDSLTDEKKFNVLDLLANLIPGRGIASFLAGILPKESPEVRATKDFYARNYGLTSSGSIASGIMQGYNPVSGGFLNMITGGRYGKPMQVGLAPAIRRRIENIATRKAPQTEASRAKIAELQGIAERDTITRARAAAPDVYSRAERAGTLGPGGGFSTSGREGAFESKSGRGRRDF